MKLGVKLILGMTILMLIFSALLTFISVLSLKSTLETKIGEAQLDLTKEAMKEIDRLMYERLQDIIAIGEDEEFEGFLSGEEGAKESQEKINELSVITGPWDELEIISADKEIKVSLDIDNIGSFIEDESPAELEAFRVAMSGRNFVSDLEFSDETGEPTIIYSAPIRDEKSPGKPIVGVVIGNLAWPVVEEILDSLDVPDIHLLDKTGITIAEGRSKHRQKQFVKSENSLIIGEIISSKSNYNIFEKGQDFDEDTLASYSKQEGFLGYRGSGWTLVIETPTRIAFEVVDSTIKDLILTSFIIIIIGTIISYFIADSIVKPIVQLKDSATRISRGNFTETIALNRNDEISDLADAFDNMRYSLKMVIDEYEKMKDVSIVAKQLKLANQKNREINKTLNNSSLVAITNLKGDITYANKKFIEISKYSKNEIIGKNHRILKSGFHTKKFYDTLWKTIVSGKIWHGVIRNMAKMEVFTGSNLHLCRFSEKIKKSKDTLQSEFQSPT